jgi:hypothetical protein
MDRNLVGLLLMVLLPILMLGTGSLHAQQVLHSRIIGVVVDQEDGKPIEGVEVGLRGLSMVRVTDARGKFEMESVPPGAMVLEFSHLGFRVRTDSIVLPPEETLEVRVTMTPDPIPLDPILVSVRSKVLEVNGFFRRREQGLSGVHLTKEQIAERRPSNLTDLFSSIPGARLANRDGVVGPVVVFPRGKLLGGGTETCYPAIWLDGVLTPGMELDQISPYSVEGIEVYQGAGAPLRFSTDCGAIIVWTQVPVKRGRGG